MIKTKTYAKKYNVKSSGTQFHELDTIINDEEIEKKLAETCTDFSEGYSDKREFIYSKKEIIKITWQLKRDFHNYQAEKIIQLKAPEETNFPEELSDLLEQNQFKEQKL